jgi:flagellar hook-length control protein FliK
MPQPAVAIPVSQPSSGAPAIAASLPAVTPRAALAVKAPAQPAFQAMLASLLGAAAKSPGNTKMPAPKAAAAVVSLPDQADTLPASAPRSAPPARKAAPVLPGPTPLIQPQPAMAAIAMPPVEDAPRHRGQGEPAPGAKTTAARHTDGSAEVAAPPLPAPPLPASPLPAPPVPAPALAPAPTGTSPPPAVAAAAASPAAAAPRARAVTQSLLPATASRDDPAAQPRPAPDPPEHKTPPPDASQPPETGTSAANQPVPNGNAPASLNPEAKSQPAATAAQPVAAAAPVASLAKPAQAAVLPALAASLRPRGATIPAPNAAMPDAASTSTAGSVTAAPAAVTPHATTIPTPAVQIAHAVAVHIAPGASGNVTIQLQPAELGAVQVRIERAHDGTATVTVQVEKPETLHSMQQDMPRLHQALDRAGLPSESRQVTLHLAPAAGSDTQTSLGSGSDGQRQGAGGRTPPRAAAMPFPESPDDEAATDWRPAGINITA